MILTRPLFAIICATLVSCVTSSSTTEISTTDKVVDPVLPEEIDQVIDFVDKHDREASGDEDEVVEIEEPEEGIPREVNEKVQKWIDYFTKKYPHSFQRFLNRGAVYKPMIERVLRDQGLPTELYYLALIESGFSTKATSRAQAVGVWQFMKGTARRYGLEVNYYVDERRDPVRSTIAASLYLSDLNNVFQSWYLTMAAYNAGESRVMNTIMRGKSRDFWDLAGRRKLPRETMNYVPKFMAALIVGSNPEKFGLKTPDPTIAYNPAPFEIKSPIALRSISKISGVSHRKLKELNPHIKRGITPPNQGTYKLWVPREKAEVFAENHKQLQSHVVKLRNLKGGAGEGVYKVRSGDTLAGISRRHGIRLKELKALNGLRSSRIYPGQKLILADTSKPSKKTAKKGTHTVKRGETLAKISNIYGVSIGRLRSMNDLRGSRIYVGQKLKVKPRVVSYRRYRVRKGETLSSIARRFGISPSKLRKLNHLNRDRIYAGQLLKVGSHKG